MKGFINALEFLTLFRIRGNTRAESEPGALASSMAWFPLVGAFQGLVALIPAYLLSFVLPWSVVAAIVLAVLMLTNGGFHLDGFADTVDGIAGGSSPEERMGIMRDSATGAVGVAAVVFLLVIKYAALSAVPEGWRLVAVFALPVAGRWSMVPLSCISVYARPGGGLGTAFSGGSAMALLASTLMAAIVMVFTLGLTSLIVLSVIGVSVFLFAVFFRRRLGGVTGDVFGFQSEVAEALCLLVIAAAAFTVAP
jgi:adenosylcobinamide-GDP ribazoletransferase